MTETQKSIGLLALIGLGVVVSVAIVGRWGLVLVLAFLVALVGLLVFTAYMAFR